MDIALQASAAMLDPQHSTDTFHSRYILHIDDGSTLLAEYAPPRTYLATLPFEQALKRLHSDAPGPETIIVNPYCVREKAGQLKEIAKIKSIPIIVYTPKYDRSVKALAFAIAADDYYYGSLQSDFFKRLDFIKKAKEYKTERGNKPYASGQTEPMLRPTFWHMKRVFDILVCSFALLMLLPLCLLIALIIKIESRGPIFYVSERAGTDYKIFNFYKFRSMRMGADTELAQLAHRNQYGESSVHEIFFKIKDDPRVTKFGQFLRNTSLDEIPQLLNVLVGDMSLVGNRPLPLYEAEKLTKDQIARRFLAPAGITGLWQITKRGKEKMSPEERIALDMEYAMKNSFWLDLKILILTFPALLQREKV